MVGSSSRTNALLSVAALVAVCALERYFAADGGLMSFGGDGLEGRRLGGNDGAYDGATRTLSEIWNADGGPTRLILTACLILVLGSLAAGAGVGGGGLFVPIYWLILESGPKGAVPLSKATILGGAVGNFISLGWQRHPKTNRPMIDYEASTFMQSGELLGVVFGVLLNKLLPAIAIIVFLVAILGWNAFRTIKKGMAIRAKETKAFEKAKAAVDKAEASKAMPASASAEGDIEATPATESRVSPPPSEPETTAGIEVQVQSIGGGEGKPRAPTLDDVKAYGSFVDLSSPSEIQERLEVKKLADAAANAADALEAKQNGEEPIKTEVTPKAELEAILKEESRQFPCWAWQLLALMTAFTMAHGFVSNAISSSSECQDWAWWLWYVAPVPVLGAFMYCTSRILEAKHKRKLAVGYEYLEADIQWSKETLKKFPVTAFMAGITAGLLGIGGGMVIGPLFLSIGMEPQVGTSSCAFMILWTAFSGVVAYGADDHLGAELACCCVGIGFISGQLGQRLVNTVLKKTGRPSYVVFLLGGIIAAATVAMTAGMILNFAQGDFNADNNVEDNEAVFYLGTGFGCDAGSSSSYNASHSSGSQ